MKTIKVEGKILKLKPLGNKSNQPLGSKYFLIEFYEKFIWIYVPLLTRSDRKVVNFKYVGRIQDNTFIPYTESHNPLSQFSVDNGHISESRCYILR